MSGGDHGVSSEDRQRNAADPRSTNKLSRGCATLVAHTVTSVGVNRSLIGHRCDKQLL